MIDKHFIERKISLIQDELLHLEPFVSLSFDEIACDFTKQAVVERILERVINRAIDINQHFVANLSPVKEVPLGYRQTFLTLNRLGIFPLEFAESIARSIGTRNKLVHEYDTVDQKQIYDSIKDCLSDYTAYCDFVLKFLEKTS